MIKVSLLPIQDLLRSVFFVSDFYLRGRLFPKERVFKVLHLALNGL